MGIRRERQRQSGAPRDRSARPSELRLRTRWRRPSGPPPATREWVRAPALMVLRDFDELNQRAGHENAGFLSLTHGFLPREAPRTQLAPAFRAWDELAAELPELHRSLQLRRRVEALPLLDASAAALDGRDVLRACALLAIVAHAYWYVDPRPPRGLPEAIRAPWAQLRARLGRDAEALSYIDLIVYNWRVIDPALPDPMVVENLDLLLPTIGNREERVFYLTQLEILARASPVVAQVASAQEAALRGDDVRLEQALEGVIACLSSIVRRSLLKIDPNPYSPLHVNPVVWAKTVAPLAVPFHAGVQGPSGTSSPLFNTLDLFLGRKEYKSFLGREIKQLRATYPRAWQSFLGALSQVPVGEYIARTERRALRAAWAEVLDLYAGQNGFLGRHRMKVYGYLELAFKVGRSVTIGGFGGVFKDRTWDQVDNELTAAQAERPRPKQGVSYRAKVISVECSQRDGAQPNAGRVVLDVAGLGLRYQPGDRCLVLPENGTLLLARTLEALNAHGDEPVAMTDEWREVMAARPELLGATQLSLREVLRYGSIRPVSPRVAEALHARTQSSHLLRRIVAGDTERLELWELLRELGVNGAQAEALWREPGGISERLCRLIPPLRPRVYSISSAATNADGTPNPVLELTVGHVRYAAQGSSYDEQVLAYGTASSFLIEAERHQQPVPFTIERPDRFVLPEDTSAPLVMIAGGTGVSPFRAFIQARAAAPMRCKDWLFLSLRTPDEFAYGDECRLPLARGSLELRLAFTRVGAALGRGEHGELKLEPARSVRIDQLMRESADALCQLLLPRARGGAGAHLYICGRGGFAASVLAELKRLLQAHQGGSEEEAQRLLYQLAGEGRLVQEIHTDAEPPGESARQFQLSEIAQHNSAEHGYWIILDRGVYDVTELMELHPGGRRIVQAYAGMDATHGFARAHHQRPDVDAMRDQYRIGTVQPCSFDEFAVRVEGPSGPVTVDCTLLHRAFVGALHMVVEMQNAFAADVSLQHERVGVEPLHEPSPYKLSRAFESHQRFQRSYLSVVTGETLPQLWRLSRGLLFADAPRDWMQLRLEHAASSTLAGDAQALIDDVWAHLDSWLSDPRAVLIQALLLELDVWFLAEMKECLSSALRVFEACGPRTRQLGAHEIRAACERAAWLVEAYHQRLASQLSHALSPGNSQRPPSARESSTGSVPQRLHTGTYWTLEVDTARKLAVLQRTPLALASLSDLSDENEQILRCLHAHHREYGLVVDTRRAPLRNDSAFEDAMARLRSGLTGHFKRTAVLLESQVGELQVTRLERDERRRTLATRSESAALKHALGGS